MASNSPRKRKRLAIQNGGMASISESRWLDNARRRWSAYQPALATSVRENRLHAAIRRLAFNKLSDQPPRHDAQGNPAMSFDEGGHETSGGRSVLGSTRVEPDDGGNDGQATSTTYSPGANDRD